MKTKSLLTLIICLVFYTATAQEKQPRLNISLGVSPPIKVDGMGKFFNEDWILYQQDPDITEAPFKRKYFKINNIFSIDYVKPKYFLRLSSGLAIRKITEQFQQDDTIINTSLGPFESVFKQNLVYSQYNWNISIGAGYRIAIEKFTPYFGTEAIFCHYGKGVQKGDYYSYVKDPNNPPPGSLDENTYTMNIPSGFGSGLGVIAGIDFAALKKIHIVFEVSEYYLFVHFNGTSSTHTIGSSYNQSTQQTTSYDSWTYHKDKFEQFSFSNFIPSIRIKYSF